MNFGLFALVFGFYGLIGFATPRLGDGNGRFFWLTLSSFIIGLTIVFTFKEMILAISLTILAGFIIGSLISLWRLKALKKSGRIITDSF